MSESTAQIVPTGISLHQKSHLLVVSFGDEKYELPCEYLRIFSRAAEVRTMQEPVVGKENVNISKIESQGSYAIRLFFDDGHNTGIYSWDTLHELGKNYESNWADYLKSLETFGYVRNAEKGIAENSTKIKVLYFIHLVKELKLESEDIVLPKAVTDVQSLLKMLRMKGEKWDHLLQDDAVQVTVNKEFSELFTRLEDGDEVAIVPLGGISKSAGKVLK